MAGWSSLSSTTTRLDKRPGLARADQSSPWQISLLWLQTHPGVADCGMPSLGIRHVLCKLIYRIVESSKPEPGGGMFRHRECAARIGWWFDNLFIARRRAVRESMLLSRLRRDCSDTRSASSQCSNERGPLAPLHGAPLNAALT